MDQPFTPAMAARAGVGRSELERMLRAGEIVRLLRGVYLAAEVPTGPMVRAQALALVVGRKQVVVDRTAAWVHGSDPFDGQPVSPIPLDLHGRRRHPGGTVPLRAADVVLVGGIRCTTPLRTALDVVRRLAPQRALVAVDGMLRAGTLDQGDLIAGAERLDSLPGGTRGRELVAIADGRAADAAETVLRMCWYASRVPTPVPALRAYGSRLALGLGSHSFGVQVLGDPEVGRADWAALGWRVLVLDPGRVLTGEQGYLAAHLEREYHQHLAALAR